MNHQQDAMIAIEKAKQTIDIISVPGRPIFPLVQMPIWVFGAAMAVRSQHTQVAIGYVMNDCALSYLDELRELWKVYGKFLRPGETWPDLHFPLIKFPKEEIAGKIYPELQEHLFWCENPNEETLAMCLTDCEPCKRSPLTSSMMVKRVEEAIQNDNRKAARNVRKFKSNTRQSK